MTEEQLRQLYHAYARAWQSQEREPHQEDQKQDQPRHRHQQQQNCDIYGAYIAQNNLGVSLLSEKRYHDAAHWFYLAVKYVNERSAYNNPNYDELQNCHGLHQNRECAFLDPNRSRSPLSTTSHTNDTPVSNIHSSATMSTTVTGATESPHASLRTTIDSFYFLLDGENNIDSCNKSASSDYDSTKCEGTYVFRNPIVVAGREPATTIENSSYPFIRTSASNDIVGNSSSPSTAIPIYPSTGRPRTAATTTFDKDACVKLSLVSVYNIALTYHLAALDSSNHRRTEANSNCLETNNINDNDTIERNTTKRGYADDAENTPDMSEGAYFAGPSKRQRVANCKDDKSNNISPITSTTNNTTMTPYGECTSPYHKNVRNETRNNNNISDSNNDTIDHGLLRQALVYYDIAYRMLVSEQNVLVSQAMVILNNIGHIHRLMGSEENAKACFRRLLTTMMYLQQTGDCRQISHWDSFLTNVIDLIVPPVSLQNQYAPAA